MKKIPKFMLTRKIAGDALLADGQRAAKKSDTSSKSAKESVKKAGLDRQEDVAIRMLNAAFGRAPTARTALNQLDSNFRNALAASAYITTASAAMRGRRGGTVSKIGQLQIAQIKELIGSGKATRVGVLDMGAWIGGLPVLLERLNKVQSLFSIFEVQAPIPGGLVKSAEGMNSWLTESCGVKVSKRDRAAMERQMIADEFFVVGEDIRVGLGLDLLVGMTPAMLAGTKSDGSAYWNHIVCVSGKTIVLSTADLREFSEQASRPFEAAIGAILVSALLIAGNDRLSYHDDTGCLFDYNERRVSLIPTMRTMRICEKCLTKMTGAQRTAALAMAQSLKSLKRRRS